MMDFAAQIKAAGGYVIDATQPFPEKWRGAFGNINVMAGPIKGYLMVRRPGRKPFVVEMADLLSGNYECIDPKFLKANAPICEEVK